jgi:hypothetical protein
MGGANTGASNEDEEANPPKELHHTMTTSIKTTSSPTRHKVRCTQHKEPSGPSPRHPTTPPHTADHQHHLSRPPSRCTTARDRAATPHDPTTHSPSCIEKLLVDHDHRTNIQGRRPGLKVKTASSETGRPSRQPRRTGNTRMSPKPNKHLLHLMKHLPALGLEATASMHIHQLLVEPPPSRAAAPTSTSIDTRAILQNRREPITPQGPRNPRQRLQQGNDASVTVARSKRSLGFTQRT